MLNCISRTNGGAKEQQKSTERISHIASEAKRQIQTLALQTNVAAPTHTLKLVSERRRPVAGILRQFKLLLSRSFKETSRGKTSIIIKLVQQVTLGLIYGGIYKVGTDQVRFNRKYVVIPFLLKPFYGDFI